MNARQRKKLARNVCPRCRQSMGIWHWTRLRTGRLVSTIVACYSDVCYLGVSPFDEWCDEWCSDDSDIDVGGSSETDRAIVETVNQIVGQDSARPVDPLRGFTAPRIW